MQSVETFRCAKGVMDRERGFYYDDYGSSK